MDPLQLSEPLQSQARIDDSTESLLGFVLVFIALGLLFLA